MDGIAQSTNTSGVSIIDSYNQYMSQASQPSQPPKPSLPPTPTPTPASASIDIDKVRTMIKKQKLLEILVLVKDPKYMNLSKTQLSKKQKKRDLLPDSKVNDNAIKILTTIMVKYNNNPTNEQTNAARFKYAVDWATNQANRATVGYGGKMTKKTQYKKGGNNKEKMNRLKQFLKDL